MGPHPDEWLQMAINEVSKISVEDDFVFSAIATDGMATPTTNSKKRK